MRHHRAKLNAKQVRQIRRQHERGKSQRSLATAFDVSTATIGQVVHRDTWRHVGMK